MDRGFTEKHQWDLGPISSLSHLTPEPFYQLTVKQRPAKFLSARITHWWDRLDSRSALLVLFLLAVLLTVVSYLIWGDDPWKRNLPQKFLDGDKLDQKQAITLGLWFGAAFNAVIVVILLATSRWWARQTNHILPPPHRDLPLWSRRLFLSPEHGHKKRVRALCAFPDDGA